MNQKTEPALGHGVSGWKARQEHSRYKITDPQTREEIRAIRKAHLMGQIDDSGAPVDEETVEFLESDSGGADSNEAARTDQPEGDAPQGDIPEIEIITHPGGWYSVEVNGIEVTDSKVRKAQAKAIAEEFRNG